MQGKPNPQQARETRRTTRHRGVSYRVKRDGSRQYYVYWEANRKLGQSPYVKAGRTEEEALAKQAELRGKKARGERVILASKRTVRTVGDEWFEQEKAGWKGDYCYETRRLLDNVIYRECGDDLVASVSPQSVLAFDKQLRASGLSESGAANCLKPLRGLLDHAVLANDIPVNPFHQIPRGKLSSCNTKRQHHEWTTEEVDRFIRTAHEFDDRETAKRGYGDQIELMVGLGLRIAEASGLRFSDVDHVDKVLHVRRQFTKRGQVVEYTKTRASRRRVPLTDERLEKINFRQAFLGLGEEDFIFANEPGGNPPSHSNFRRRGWNRVVEATGLKLEEGVKVTPHDARHATASQLGELKLEAEDAAALLGHTSGKITKEIYTHAFDRDKREERIREKMRAAQNGEHA
jgi:integrase